MLSERQQLILGARRRRATSSREARRLEGDRRAPEVDWSPSTCAPSSPSSRRAGFLTHPHTSAGRVPTDAGYRFYAEPLLASGERLPPGAPATSST